MALVDDSPDPEDTQWLIDTKLQALLEYQTLSYISEHINKENSKKLQSECGKFSLGSLKLKAFIQMFNKDYLSTAVVCVGGAQPDSQGVPKSLYNCWNVNGCISHTMQKCDAEGWLLRTAQI